MNQTSSRYALLDELRGLNLISMMIYHGMWDLIYIFGVWVGWYADWQGHLWQQSICWVFILLSGFCLPFGHHSFRRGATVFGAGAVVTVVTMLFMPEDVVWFGVLTLLGSAMLITALLEKTLQKIPPVVGFFISFALFVLTYHSAAGYWGVGSLYLTLPAGLFRNYLTAFVGFYPVGFYSTDYFPLLPWMFLFWTGVYLHHLIGKERMQPLHKSICPPLGWLGRHSLILYMLHQPVIYGVLTVVFAVLRSR